MNQVIITGRLGKDAYFQPAEDSKKAFAVLEVAVDQGEGRDGTKREPMWFHCKAFGVVAERIARKKLKTGDQMLVQGSMNCSTVKDEQSGEYYKLGEFVIGYTEIQTRKHKQSEDSPQG